jgi:hypothetical protein
MTLLPLRQGCALLGIDPKTLRHWMQQAHLSLYPHPSDARIKCVTPEHLERLAALHHRPVDVPAVLAQVHPAETSSPLLPETPFPKRNRTCSRDLLPWKHRWLWCNNTWLHLRSNSSRSGPSAMSNGCTPWRHAFTLHLSTTHRSLLSTRHVSRGANRTRRSQPRECIRRMGVPVRSSLWSNTPLMAPTSSSVHIRENWHLSLIHQHGLSGWRRSPRYVSWVSRGGGAPTVTRGGHRTVGLPIAVSTGISMSMLLAVLTNLRLPVLSRWRPRFNPTSRFPSF